MAAQDMRITLMAARVNAMMSREQVERATGIKYATLARIETGKVEPRASDLQKLCLLYKVGIENLRFDNVEPLPMKPRRKAKGEDGKEA